MNVCMSKSVSFKPVLRTCFLPQTLATSPTSRAMPRPAQGLPGSHMVRQEQALAWRAFSGPHCQALGMLYPCPSLHTPQPLPPRLLIDEEFDFRKQQGFSGGAVLGIVQALSAGIADSIVSARCAALRCAALGCHARVCRARWQTDGHNRPAASGLGWAASPFSLQGLRPSFKDYGDVYGVFQDDGGVSGARQEAALFPASGSGDEDDGSWGFRFSGSLLKRVEGHAKPGELLHGPRSVPAHSARAVPSSPACLGYKFAAPARSQESAAKKSAPSIF